VPGRAWTPVPSPSRPGAGRGLAGRRDPGVRLEAALRAGLAARGLPRAVYVDNGSAFVSRQLLRACAVLGIRLVHSRPGRPQGRGKIERFFRTVREQFLIELAAPGTAGADDLDRLNQLFQAWVETVYHRRVHTETGQPPIQRLTEAEPPALPCPAQLREAFLWSVPRTVTKTATVSLAGNLYQVDPALVGRRVELVFDPFDLTDMEVRYAGRAMGAAVPHRLARHVHPHTRPEQLPPPAPTGIDYLTLIEAAHTAELAHRIDYATLPDDPDRAADTDHPDGPPADGPAGPDRPEPDGTAR
jgi:putative transposase